MELHLVMDYVSIIDQCQNLGSHGYSTKFCMDVLNPLGDKIEATITDPDLKRIMEVLLPHRYK